MSLRWVVGFLWVIGSAALGACDTAPTLPLPPPVAMVSSANSQGVVSVEGQAKSLALLFLFNEDTEHGVIGRADETGDFVLVIEAQGGDALTLWQQQGKDKGQPVNLIVPEP